MDIVIVGAGKIGRHICAVLNQEDHNLRLIEQDEETLERVTQTQDLIGIVGNGSSFRVQREAEVQQADVFIALTHQDEVNLMACVIAKSLGAKFTIARVRNPDYADYSTEMRNALGISLLINPDLLAAREISRMIQFPNALSVEPFAFNRVNLVAVMVPQDHAFIGRDLVYFRQQTPGVLVCSIERDGESFIPDGRTILEAEDRLHLTGSLQSLRKIYKLFSSGHDVLHSLMIVGAGHITSYLLTLLGRNNMEIKIIEQSRRKAELLAELFPHTHVALGDGTNQIFLLEEGIESYDCTLALTGIDEENILVSLFSAASKVPRNITKVNRLELLRVIQSSELQSIVTPYELATNEILRVIRSLNQDETSDMEAMYRIAGGQVEAMQFEVREQSRIIDKPLSKLELKPHILIGYIVRGRDVIVPGGSDSIRVGDHVIVVTQNQAIVNLDDCLL